MTHRRGSHADRAQQFQEGHKSFVSRPRKPGEVSDRVHPQLESIIAKLYQSGGDDPRRLEYFLGCSNAELTPAVGGVIESTAADRQRTLLEWQALYAVSRLTVLCYRLMEVGGNNEAAARAWLNTPNQMLGNKTPREMILSGTAEDVDAMLVRLEEGIPS